MPSDVKLLEKLIYKDKKNKAHKLHKVFYDVSSEYAFCNADKVLDPKKVRHFFMQAAILSPESDNALELMNSIQSQIPFLNAHLHTINPYMYKIQDTIVMYDKLPIKKKAKKD